MSGEKQNSNASAPVDYNSLTQPYSTWNLGSRSMLLCYPAAKKPGSFCVIIFNYNWFYHQRWP